MGKRVVITGMGPISSIGIGKSEFFKNILSHKTNILKIPDSFNKNYEFKSKFYSPFPEVSFSEYEFPKLLEKITSRPAKLSIIGTLLALNDAGFYLEKKDKFFSVKNLSNCGIILGIGFSDLEISFKSYLAHKKLENVNFNRMIIPMMMPNSVSSWVSIIYGLHGTNYTINTACASGTYAIGEAFNKIKNTECQLMITGGVECLKDEEGGIMRGFDLLGTLTQSSNGLPMPFSKKRSGFLFSEGGGCILILEELEHAKKRKADIYAEIIGYESNSDAYNIVQMNQSGQNIKQILKKITNNNKIDYFNTHGTGTLLNDKTEAKIIHELFGNKNSQPYINSTKGILGHSIAASGAFETAVTALSIKNNEIHGNEIEDPIENLNLAQNSFNCNINLALSTSYGFGGHNSALLFQRID